MSELLKLLSFVLLSGTKFFFALPALIFAGYSPIETILISTFGGILSFFIFYYFGRIIKEFYYKKFPPKRKAKTFSRKNRWLIKVKDSYGLWGIAIITPSVLGIPLGALLASAFFKKGKQTILIFVFWIVFWSITMSYSLDYFT